MASVKIRPASLVSQFDLHFPHALPTGWLSTLVKCSTTSNPRVLCMTKAYLMDFASVVVALSVDSDHLARDI